MFNSKEFDGKRIRVITLSKNGKKSIWKQAGTQIVSEKTPESGNSENPGIASDAIFFAHDEV